MRRPGRSWRHSSSARCRPLVSTLMPLPDPWWNVPGKPFLSKSSLSSSAQLRWQRNRCAPDDVHGDGGSSWTCLHSQQVRRRLAVPRSRWIAGKAFSAASANNRGGTISRRFPGALVARSASGLRKRRAGGKALAPALCDRRGGAGLGGSAARCTRWDAVTLLPCSTSRGRWSGSCAQRCSVFSARGPGTGALAVAGWAVCSRRPNAPGR